MGVSSWWRKLQGAIEGPGAWLVAVLVFWACAMRNLEAPGIYMDAINPDYLVARWLSPALENPAWVMPGPTMPWLGNLYHGTQTFWFGLLTYGFLGTSVSSARITHALFGAFLVLLAWLVVRRASGRPWLALAAATGLATDMAFLGSFRTQAYIILAGQVWMMLAFYLAIRATAERGTRVPVLLSGVGMGLAAYGYFIFLFFLPVVALLAVLGPGRTGAARRSALWAAGFVIGMTPYVLGYVLLAVDVGGVGPFIEWMHNAVTGLKPTQGSSSYLQGLSSAFDNARLALSGGGNELMMTGTVVSSGWPTWRAAVLAVAGVVCVGGALRERHENPPMAAVLLASAALPVVFIAVAAWFGSRMWAHHFTVLVTLGYVLVGMAASWLHLRLRRSGTRILGGAGVLLAGLWLAGNLAQQQQVHHRLAATGGSGMSTDAMSAMARAALTERWSAAWYFPDWGFFMPFAFLTGNQVAYEIETTPAALGRHRGTRDGVRVAFWKAADRERHTAFLQENGVHDIRHYVLLTRDGQPAIHVLAGNMERPVDPLTGSAQP